MRRPDLAAVLAAASEAGVEVRRYNPPRFVNPLRLISRDHRKILCVDGAVAFTGGLCIGHDWVGNPARGVPPWRDTAVEIRGPAVADIEAAFADSWGRSAGAGCCPRAAAGCPPAGGQRRIGDRRPPGSDGLVPAGAAWSRPSCGAVAVVDRWLFRGDDRLCARLGGRCADGG